MTVERLLREISSDELTEWMAFYQIEPFGQAWEQTGILASLVANAMRSETQPPYLPSDFMPQFPVDGSKDSGVMDQIDRMIEIPRNG